MVHMFNHNNVDNIQICLDIPFIDHPYLIGPRGRKCQHLMDRYKTLIHFPDSNRRSGGPKLNNVLVNGSMKNAEEVRNQLRNRTPIRLAVQLQHFADVPNLIRQMEEAITERSLPIRLNCSEDNGNGMLKTEWRNEDTLIKFCDEFLDLQDAVFKDAEIFTIAETILPLVNPWNSELSHWIIEHIYDLTKCRVFYPPKEKFADQPPSYFVKGGSASGVLKAARFITGLTMFQVSFSVYRNSKVDPHLIEEWQNNLLVHTSFEPVYKQNNEFSHQKVTLRSFEFCVNNVYIVRSLLLGFKKTVQTASYEFMASVKNWISGDVFSTAQLYFPLFAIDDERSFNWNLTGQEFFKTFYGTPQSPRQPAQCNEDLTSRLQSLLNIPKNDDSNNNPNGTVSNRLNTSPNANSKSPGSNGKNNSSYLLSSNGTPVSIECARASPPAQVPQKQPSKQYREFRQKPPQVYSNQKDQSHQRFRGTHLSAPEDRFTVSSPNVFNAPSGSGQTKSVVPPSAFIFSSCIAATSPSTLEHEDDPELQAILRKTMPCLEVTKEQLESVNREAMARAVHTADNFAMMTDPFHRPFNYAEYSVSYPAQASVEEFNRQFENFLLERDRYYHMRALNSSIDPVTKGMDEEADGSQRKSASF